MTEGLRSIRPLPPESLRGIEMAPVGKKLPRFEVVDPKTLYVEDSYQRSMSSENSTRLVRKIVGKFSWARFKPPICVRLPESGNILVCIDGQHTATAAASHPGVDKIPVMVVDAEDVAARAGAFVGHNRDRLGLTQMAIYYAELAAGDPIAGVVDRACKKAGVTILIKSVNLTKPTRPGDTIAVGTIKALAKSHGAEVLGRVLGVLVRAGRGPIKADEIAAVAAVVIGRDDDPVLDGRLSKLIASQSAERWKASASSLAADTGESLPTALAVQWYGALGLKGSPIPRKKNAFGAANAIPPAPKSAKPAPAPPPKEAPMRLWCDKCRIVHAGPCKTSAPAAPQKATLHLATPAARGSLP
jgi:hypothetical protein